MTASRPLIHVEVPAPAPPTRTPVDWTGVGKILGLAVLTCLCYWPSLGGGFLWDDDLLVTHDTLVQSWGGLRRIWFSTEPYDYFPLTYTSFWLEWPLWGADPLGYRVVNLLLHVASAFLLWRLLARWKVPGAWFAALLFALHPVNVASVAWIAERKNTLSMVFFLASVSCWVEAEEPLAANVRRRRWYGAAVGAFALAALSKSSVVMLPCVLLLLVWWRRGRVGRGDLLRSAPFFGISLATGLLTIWFQLHRSMDPDWQRTAAPPLLRVLIAGRAMLFYLGKALVPVRLSMIYPRWDMHAGSVTAWLPLLAVAALFVTAWHGRGKWGRGPITALGCSALMLLPVSGLVPMTFAMYSFVSDHFVYLPLLSLLAGAAAVLMRWSERGGTGNRYAAYGVMALLAGLFAAASVRRAGEFSSSQRLWEATLKVNPDCAIAHNNLGRAVEGAGRLPAAEAHFRAALLLDPGLTSAATNLAAVLQREGRWREAAAAYASALDRSPNPMDYNNLGVVLLQLGEEGPAREQFQCAARMDPTMLSPRFNLYKVALAQGDSPSAADELRACLRIDPDDVPSLLALTALEIKARGELNAETITLAERACRLTRWDDPVALGTLSSAYLAGGRREDAATIGERAQAQATRQGQAELAGKIGEYLARSRAVP